MRLQKPAALCCAALAVTALCLSGASISADVKEIYTTFDPPGSAATYPTSINSGGAIAGSYDDSTGAPYGFVRAADGTIATFDPTGSVYTLASSINGGGTVGGTYGDGTRYHGFLRASDGTITTFDVGTSFMNVTGINRKDATTGYFSHVKGKKTRTFGFVRRGNGAVKEFKVPGAYTASYPESINAQRWVTGYYRDRAGVYHGFLQAP